MEVHFLITLCIVFALSKRSLADTENEIKRGVYPFMAYIYYPDETVVDAEGMRFLRSAVLIRPDWLITSAVGLSTDDGITNGFPKSTLLARSGTSSIDANFTLNEDEDEQEREIIQIVRPYNHSATLWWRTDISMMKTLLPFNMTTSVSEGTLSFNRDYGEKSCIILVYTTKYGKLTEDKILMKLSVDLLPPSMEKCGKHYVGNTMICSADSQENKNYFYNPKFCHGNSGGPLICNSKVIGIQTYVEKNCKQPHLYHLLSAWEDFITCSTEEKFQEEQCSNICAVTNKDTTTTQSISTPQPTTTSYLTTTSTVQTTEKTTISTVMTEQIIEQREIEIVPTLTSVVSTTITERSTTEAETELLLTELKLKGATDSAINIVKTLDKVTLKPEPWPIEKDKDARKKMDEDDGDVESRVNVEAQQQDMKVTEFVNNAQRNMSVFKILLFSFLVVACYI